MIPAGVRTYRLPVFALNDFLVEGPETVDLTITPDASYVVGIGTDTVTIVDDDLPDVIVSALIATAVEGGTQGQLMFTRTGNPERALTVNYVVSGTAQPGTDYTLLSGSVTIPVGSVDASVNINAINDGEVEGNETVIVNITDSVFYNIGTPGAATVTIQDAQMPTVTVTHGVQTAAEGGASGTFIVSRTGPTTNALTVTFSVGARRMAALGPITPPSEPPWSSLLDKVRRRSRLLRSMTIFTRARRSWC